MTNFNWYFTREEIDNKSPSRDDGVTLATEIRYRQEGARLIINASNTLGLRYETTATGVVFFHRFFMIQSFRQFSRWVVASACLLLAGKVEETPKKCRDIIKVCQSLLTEQQMTHHFGSNPKDELTTHERILLQTIKFDLQVEHPYSYLLKFAKQLLGEKAKIEKLVQMAWTFMNDSLCTSLCLQWEPQAIAIAFVYLAGKLSKFDLVSATQSKSRSWWRQYLDTLDVHDLESICHLVLDIYGEEENKSSEEGGTTGESATPFTSHSAHQIPPTTATIASPFPQQQHQPTPPPGPYPPPTAGVAPHPSPTGLQQYAVHYQQHPNSIQQTRAAALPYGIPGNQTLGLACQTLRQPAPSGPTQPGGGATPLGYSTLNVNVSTLATSHGVAGILSQPQSLVPGTGGPAGGGASSYQYPSTFPLPGGVVRGAPSSPAAATPVGIQHQQRSFATGSNAYPIQSYNKAMTLFVGTGGTGQTGLTRQGVAGSSSGVPNLMSLGVPSRGIPVGRGSLNSTPPPRPPHPGMTHVRSNLAPQLQVAGYHPNSTPRLPQNTPGGGGGGVVRPPTTASSGAWP